MWIPLSDLLQLLSPVLGLSSECCLYTTLLFRMLVSVLAVASPPFMFLLIFVCIGFFGQLFSWLLSLFMVLVLLIVGLVLSSSFLASDLLGSHSYLSSSKYQVLCWSFTKKDKWFCDRTSPSEVFWNNSSDHIIWIRNLFMWSPWRKDSLQILQRVRSQIPVEDLNIFTQQLRQKWCCSYHCYHLSIVHKGVSLLSKGVASWFDRIGRARKIETFWRFRC